MLKFVPTFLLTVALRLSVLFLFTLGLVRHEASAATYDEKCEVGLTSDNRRLDTCLTSKFLTCQETRCVCQDPKNQIWSSRRIPVSSSGTTLSRSRREPKKSGFKTKSKSKSTVIVPVIIPAVAVGHSHRATSRPQQKYETIYACHSRVGGTCLLDASKYSDSLLTLNVVNKQESAQNTSNDLSSTDSNNVTSISTTTEITTNGTTSSTSTTTEGSIEGATVTMADENNTEIPSTVSSITSALTTESSQNSTVNTTTTLTPIVTSSESNKDTTLTVTRIPKCVQNAVCKPRQVKIVNGTVIEDKDDPKDSRLGVCECVEGYVKNNKDVCVKSGSAAIFKSFWGTGVFALSSVLLLLP